MKRHIVYITLYSLLTTFFHLHGFGQVVPKLQAGVLNEVSGLVSAGNNLIFVHNDSGDTSRIFAINANGELIATLHFNGDPKLNRLGVLDCEDMAAGPGPKEGKSYLYLGDIGDNAAARPFVSVYRFQEPEQLSGLMHLNSEVIHLKYPNGSQDAETIMVDPVLKELVIVSKRQDSVGIYTSPLAFKNGDTVKMRKIGSLFLAGDAPAKFVVSGDISRDGRQVLLKTYDKVYHWLRVGNESISKTLSRKPSLLPYIQEPQGEAIGFTPDGKQYYCIGEGKNPIMYKYLVPKTDKRKKSY